MTLWKPASAYWVLVFGMCFVSMAGDACLAGGSCDNGSCPFLLQVATDNIKKGQSAKFISRSATSLRELDRHDLSGKSVYLVMQDRFNRVDPINSTENPDCIAQQSWCGGTLKGITQMIPYIVGMGFDAIWITPVVKQSPLEDAPSPGSGSSCFGSGYSYHGYWAENYYEIDPSYGTSLDLQLLVKAVHSAGMVIVLDIVMNHMRPIHQSTPGFEVEGITPFNDPKYYHQRQASGLPASQSWSEYTEKFCDWLNPAQALGPGTLCYLNITNGTPDYTNNGNYCNNYEGNPFGSMEYNNDTFLGPDAAGPAYLKYCGPGNYCEGYNQTLIWEGWFYDLGDLNHSQPFVRQTQFDWVKMMAKKYSLDGIRLDTAPYMPWDYLKELQAAASPLQIIGEVTSSNISWHASFQSKPELGPVLAGMENFPPFYVATPGYCNDSGNLESPAYMGSLEGLGRVMKEQISSGLYTNLGTLMNFMDNQDYNPMASFCTTDASIKNSLTWVMLSYGMPVITWGTEQGNTVYRNTLWSLGFSTSTWQYKFIQKLNFFRRQVGIAKASTEVVAASKNQLVFVCKTGASSVWVFTNNLNISGPVEYPVAPEPCARPWIDAISGKPFHITTAGSFIAPSIDPVVLYPA